jgi:DNA-binding NarL/FixJ family response regulator
MKTLRILLADDHTLVRAGIRALLEQLDGVQVVAEADNGDDALRLVEEQRPDIALLDIAMSGVSGLDVAQRVAECFPGVRVIILSMHSSEEYVWRALNAGAAGYLLKDSATAELELAVRAIAQGQTYLSPAVSKYVIADYVRRVGGGLERGSLNQLTPRQREVLQLVAEGCTTQDIAHRLGISVKTVESHRAQIMDRLDIHDIAGLVRYAIRNGLIRPEG